MKKIESLTAEQEKRMDEVYERYSAIGLATGPIDRAAAGAYVRKLYEFMELPQPEKILFARGPLEAWSMVVEAEGLTGEGAKNFVWPYLDGQFSSYYSAWVSFMREIGVDIDVDTGVIDDALGFGPIWPLDKVCVVCERMAECHLDAEGLPHRDGGPAISYGDGYRMWSLHGVSVPEWLVMTPEEKLDPAEFSKIENMEVRREFVRKIGIERLLSRLPHEVLDRADVEIGLRKLPYELVEIDLGAGAGRWPYLKMLNPSLEGVWHLECVDRGCRTVLQALAWRNQTEELPEVLT